MSIDPAHSMEEPTPPTSDHQQRQDIWQYLAELTRTVIIVALIAFSIRFFVLQPFIVDGESMSPKLHTNDYLLVDKLTYRFEAAQRGDIVVFKYPLDPSFNYVKRVIGLPGETVKIENGTVTIVNAEHPNGFTLDETYLPAGLKTEFLSGEVPQTFTVPSDSYFVLGDNRGNSSDSRQWGELPKSDVIGKVMLRAYPFNKITVISHVTYTG